MAEQHPGLQPEVPPAASPGATAGPDSAATEASGSAFDTLGDLPLLDGVRIARPQPDQFAFWVGSWRVRSSVGEEIDGRNEVCWTLDGKVLWEQFSAGSDPFTGWSFSVPVADRGWVQTWVDNTGAYLDFVGGWLGDRMVLERSMPLRSMPQRSTGRAPLRRQRMTWHSIEDSSFVWDWASCLSQRDDAPWDVMWRLHYDRR